jgi:putative DNA primase/helicase
MTGLKLHPKTGLPLKTLENVRTVLDEWPAIRGRIELDTFHNQIIARARLPWQYDPDKTYKFPHEWTDADRAELNLAVEKILGFNAPNLIDTAFTACAAQNTYHPIKNYLNGLEWDGEPRLDTLFIDYLGVKDTPYTRAVTRKAFVAAVRRIRHPGIKFDNMLILSGPQGGYKSTILHMMAGKWFSDSIRTFEGKDAMEALRGVWLMEVSELEAMRRSEVTAVKAFLSKTADRYRAAYGRYVNEYPRQCVMFGTTNSSYFLSDITGGRRFWPLRTDEQLRLKDVPKDLPLERDQIWAEAVHYDQLGEAIYLDTYELQQEAKREQEEYREADPWEATIKEFVERPVPVDWNEWPIQRRHIYWAGVAQGDLPPATERRRVCAAEVWVEALGKRPEDMTQTEARRINSILSSLPGWEKKGKMPPEHPYGRQRAFVRNISD